MKKQPKWIFDVESPRSGDEVKVTAAVNPEKSMRIEREILWNALWANAENPMDLRDKLCGAFGGNPEEFCLQWQSVTEEDVAGVAYVF